MIPRTGAAAPGGTGRSVAADGSPINARALPFDAVGPSTEPAEIGPGSVSVGFVGTYPPTRCGIATFTASLREAMAPPRSGVVASVDEAGAVPFGSEVVAELVRGSAESLEAAAVALEGFDVIVVQHEFGIYGGKDGSEVVDLVRKLSAPTIVVLHTALHSPSPSQRAIVEELAAAAELVIVQSIAARSRILELHQIPASRLRVVPHGAPANVSPLPAARNSRRPVVLSWGLLGPSKGIEFGIEALTALRDLDPQPRYVVHGQTHPRVLAQEGEAYRQSLIERARALGVDDLVEFDDGYGDTASLLAWIREADAVLLPYRSRDQVVSGVLAEAIASGRPVVATRFPHAVELLSEGSGILVPYEDSAAISAALRTLLSDPEAAARAAAVARQQAPPLFWENVGLAYRNLAESVAATNSGEELTLAL
jgi:glycosyltransferase involved in cell wall biosynthesis